MPFGKKISSAVLLGLLLLLLLLYSRRGMVPSANTLTVTRETFRQYTSNRQTPDIITAAPLVEIKAVQRADLDYSDSSNTSAVAYENSGSSNSFDSLVRPNTSASDLQELLQTLIIIPNVSLNVQKPFPSMVKLLNHYWQTVDDLKEIYLYSAFYDDRPTVAGPYVRVIGVAEADLGPVFCLHWYRHQANPDVAIAYVEAIGPRISPKGDRKYEQNLFTCSLVPGKGPPDTVSLVTTFELHPSNLLRVQIPERPRQKIEFGHCMSVVYWKHDPYRVVEWLELHRMWGVEEVTVYNNSLDDATAAVFQRYAKTGFVDFRQMPSALNNNNDDELTILLNMSPSINDCLYRNMYRYKWIVCTDLDEMIVPRSTRSYHDMLQDAQRATNATLPAHSYMFANVYFFTDLGAVSREPWFLWTPRYLRHIRPSRRGYSVKSITSPLACTGLQNHLCWRRADANATRWNVEVAPSIGMNYHYKKCHLDEYEGRFGLCNDTLQRYSRDYTMRRFSRELYSAVVARLLKIGLIEEEDK